MAEWSRKTLFLNYHLPLPTSYKFWGFSHYGRTWQNWHFHPFWELPLRQQTFLKASEIQWASVSAVLVVHVRSSGSLGDYCFFPSSCCFMWRGAFKLYLLFYKHIFHVVEAAPSSCIAPCLVTDIYMLSEWCPARLAREHVIGEFSDEGHEEWKMGVEMTMESCAHAPWTGEREQH